MKRVYQYKVGSMGLNSWLLRCLWNPLSLGGPKIDRMVHPPINKLFCGIIKWNNKSPQLAPS